MMNLRVDGRRGTVAEVQTIEPETQPAAPPEVAVSHIWGEGTDLGTETPPIAAISLSAEEDEIVGREIERQLFDRANRMIENLLQQMFDASLTEEQRDAFVQWAAELAVLLRAAASEGRTATPEETRDVLADLIIDAIWPALVGAGGGEERALWYGWEKTAREALQLLLPDGVPDLFMQQRMKQLYEQELDEENRLRQEAIDKLVAAGESAVLRALGDHVEVQRGRIVEQLGQLYAARSEHVQRAFDRTQQLTQEVNQVVRESNQLADTVERVFEENKSTTVELLSTRDRYRAVISKNLGDL